MFVRETSDRLSLTMTELKQPQRINNSSDKKLFSNLAEREREWMGKVCNVWKLREEEGGGCLEIFMRGCWMSGLLGLDSFNSDLGRECMY